MGAILDQTVDRAIKKGWISTADAEPVKARIGKLAQKYGFSVDDFAIASHTESYGMNPKAGCIGGGCFGIIQWCASTGLKTTGKSKSQICSESILQQLESVDKFFGAFDKTRNAGSLDLADLYLAILYPASVGIKDMNATIPAGRQAAPLHEGGTTSGRITKNSLIKGLKQKAAENLGSPIGASNSALAKTGGGAIPGDFKTMNSGGNTAVGAVGIISGVFNSNCTTPFPREYTIAEALTYVGCQVKMSSAQLGGTGFGQSAPAGGGLGPSQTVASVGGSPYKGRLAPGGYINPCPAGTVVTSPYGPRTHPISGKVTEHKGIDFGTPQGTDIRAAADGTVIYAQADNGGFGQCIQIEHGGNSLTLYGHMNKIGVSKGQRVKQGDVIGKSGGAVGTLGAGSSTGAHLHFQIHVSIQSGAAYSGQKIDPAPLLRGQ